MTNYISKALMINVFLFVRTSILKIKNLIHHNNNILKVIILETNQQKF